jgi:GNAT superfamily N-acetyltransferase
MVLMHQIKDIRFEWRGTFTSAELNALHAEAFETRIYSEEEWNWWDQVNRHSFGWVVARHRETLVGFVNVVSDGVVHAWLQDTMVADDARGAGIGTKLVAVARDEVREAGYEWLHVDFDDELEPFYFGACGFTPTNAGLIRL